MCVCVVCHPGETQDSLLHNRSCFLLCLFLAWLVSVYSFDNFCLILPASRITSQPQPSKTQACVLPGGRSCVPLYYIRPRAKQREEGV